MDFMERLQSLTAREPETLNDEEKAFVRARSFYLTPGEERKFKDVLHPKKPEVVKVEVKKPEPVKPVEPKVKEEVKSEVEKTEA